MHRRSFLAGVGTGGVAVGLVGWSSFGRGTPDESPAPNRVVRLRVVNESETDDRVNVNLVRNGDVVYMGQHEVPAGESSVATSNWTEKGRTFALFGETKTFCNSEVAALDAKSSTETTYEGRFTVTESGDLEGGFASVASE